MEFPEFDGRVIKPNNADYQEECYQYASSSYLDDGIIQPAAIIKAANENDVIKAINYARDNGIAVAVRTGGHQYSGASSTNGKNIQLDLSQTYMYKDPVKDFENFKWNNPDCTSVTVGVSFTLGEFNAKLREKNRFVPHGQCQYVNLGGHIQTGGYGQLARSFGLLSDYVEKFRIITVYDKVTKARWVYKDYKDMSEDEKKDITEDENNDLFFAVLGGSPGNFGVLTHVTLHVFKDQDYPNSRGLRAAYPFDRQRLKDLLDIMVNKMVDDDEFPADYDYCISVLDEPPFTTYEITYDMKYDRKEGQPQVTWPPMIVIFVQWANLQGDKQTYDSTFIDSILEAAGGKDQGIIQVSDKECTPLSTLTGHWIVPITREFKLPYFKRTYSSNASSQRLREFKWTDWVSDRIEEGCSGSVNALSSQIEAQGSNLSAQFQHFGGSRSRFYQNGNNSPTSFSWRDTRLGCTLDAFYYSYQQDVAKNWVKKNDDEGVGNSDARFCEDDRRVLWGSHDLDLSAAHRYYYDSEEKYDRLCNIKQTFDPSGVFTPNRFCIGLEPEVPSAEKRKIKPLLSAEDKFWKMASMESKVGKPVPLWNTWRA
ncbi:hypothetical protein C1645_787632 [Glomus cerebriforme]|uniref:FAD-binding PCMH-type domain-containing protein n=1 Tax=Glomus cerebriforme TaxID=658196 RepID=A0A397SFL3_9GLOM|nr:hypothetical protein C1645_787632 [Glomus cerebriforme]